MDWKDQLAQLQGLVPQAEKTLEQIQAEKEQAKQQAKDAKKPRLRVELDKRRKGKIATLITGHTGTDQEVETLAKWLKQRLAIGGSTRDGEILLQGDVREKATELLKAEGYRL